MSNGYLIVETLDFNGPLVNKR